MENIINKPTHYSLVGFEFAPIYKKLGWAEKAAKKLAKSYPHKVIAIKFHYPKN